jgi:hypothetical protein
MWSGALFQGVSLRAYLELAASEEGAAEALQALEGHLTKEQVKAIQEREQALFGPGGDVKQALPRLQKDLEHETYRRLLPGYVRNFFEHALPHIQLTTEGDLNKIFSLRPKEPGALDAFWPVLETYPAETRNRFSFVRPEPGSPAIFVHPGEPFFDYFLGYVNSRLGRRALSGGVFVDVTADSPYLFHLAEVCVERQADPAFDVFAQPEVIETRLIALRQDASGAVQPCPVESLLLLRGGKELSGSALSLASQARDRLPDVEQYLGDHILQTMVETQRQALLSDLPQRAEQIKRGYAYQEAELAAARARYTAKANAGTGMPVPSWCASKSASERCLAQKETSLAILKREPELIAAGAKLLSWLTPWWSLPMIRRTFSTAMTASSKSPCRWRLPMKKRRGSGEGCIDAGKGSRCRAGRSSGI